MKRFIAVLTLLATASAGLGQDAPRIYSRPPLPPPGLLDRLNLDLAWRTAIPMDGRRDGFYSVQVFEDVIIAQTHSGTAVAINTADGSTRWRVRIGIPYRVVQLVGLTPQSVLAYGGMELFALDRNTGAVQYQVTPAGVPTAPPAGDAERIYLPIGGGRLDVFELPGAARGPRAESGAAAAAGAAVPGGPTYTWSFPATAPIEHAPFTTSRTVIVLDANGAVTALLKHTAEVDYRLQTETGPSAPAAQLGDTGYWATKDWQVHALDLPSGRISWRYRAAGPVLRRLLVTDEDIYIPAERAGLARLRRDTGELLWRNPDVDRFLAQNRKLVYALDPHYNLLVLDRARGTVLTAVNVRDFVVPVRNDYTDRLFLASNDGLIVCLHDRGYPRPLRWRSAPIAPPPTGRAAPPKPSAAKKPAADVAPEE